MLQILPPWLRASHLYRLFCMAICFVTLHLGLLAQQAVHFVIGEQELANVEVYSLHQGEDEILYAATDHGLFAYKHGAFTPIKGPEKQHGSSLFNLQRDHKGRLFCNNLSGQVFVLTDHELKLFYEADRSIVAAQFSFGFDAQNHLIIASKVLGKVAGNDNKLEIIREWSGGSSYYWLHNLPNGTLLAIPPSEKSILIFDDAGEFPTEIPLVFDLKGKAINFFPVLLGEEIVGINVTGELQATQDISLQQGYTPKTRERFFQFNAREIFGLDVSKGLRLIAKEGAVLLEKEVFFQDKFISTMTQGQRGNLFFGTFGEGIFVVPNRQAKRINTAQATGQLRGISADKEGAIFLTTRAGELFRYQDDLQLLSAKDGFPLGRIFTFDAFDFRIDKRYPHVLYDAEEYPGSLKNAKLQADGSILLASSIGVTRLGKPSASSVNETPLWLPINERLQELKQYKERCYAAMFDPTGDGLFVATGTQLQLIDQAGNSVEVKFKGRSLSCNDLILNGKQIIAATQNEGLLFIENGSVVEQIDNSNGLESNFVTKMIKVGEQLYVAHQQGVQAINLVSKSIKHFGCPEGLPNGSVRDLALTQDHIWLLVDDEFISIARNNRRAERISLKLTIDSIVVAGFGMVPKEHEQYLDEQNFNHDQNRIEFHIDFRLIEVLDEATMAYQLENYDSDWQVASAKDAELIYKSLPSGTYTFHLKAKWREFESATFKYRFTILLPYWRQWWFYLLCALALAMLIGMGFGMRIRQIRKLNQQRLDRQEMEKNLVESKLKALRSQMNPHFIFNSLNSIQDLILKQDTDLAYDYVVLFADLVRSTLRYSEQEHITISDELAFLETYLNLEKLRFKDAFSFKLVYSESLDIEIPSMVIQPFIENALQHGLLHKKGQKDLQVHFELGEVLICTVTDNGIGREAAAQIRARQGGRHESFSLDAIQKRLDILQMHENDEKEKTGYQIEDLFEGTVAIGTRVTIRMAYKRKF